jgi:two-component system nitrate/nitrite sensor histidine kinase NarX
MTRDNENSKSSSGSELSQPERFPILHILVGGKLLLPFGFLAASLVASLLIALLLFLNMGDPKGLTALLLLLGGIAVVAGVVGGLRLRSQLLMPLVRLEDSVAEVCEGSPLNTLPFENVGVLGAVVHDIDNLSGELTELYEDMEERVDRQTRRLAQQTASLKILYDVAASINQTGDLDDLLVRFLRILKDMVQGRSATVSLVTSEGRMRLVGSIGLDDQFVSGRQQLPLHLCDCGRTLSLGDILCEQDPSICSSALGRPMFSSKEVEQLEVPLEYQGERFGHYHLYVERSGIAGREDLLDLLVTIGSHLGMAIAKRHLDEEARRLSIMEERATMAHELHDSLAQTLASLRFQVRMLEDTLEKSEVSDAARSELQRISHGIDEAHTELRELLNSFLAPVEQQGLEPALKKLTRRFRQETGIPIFFQRDCPNINLSAGEEKQVIRIIQECLANIRKHAGAHNVRILLSCVEDGDYLFLVEDDGVGFDEVSPEGEPGEHLGLSIMEERAKRLGGELSIESEPGEGTRVELVYNPGARRIDKNQIETF